MVAAASLPQSAPPSRRLIASPWHTLFVLALGALGAYRATIFAARARAGLGPSRPYFYLRTMLFECLLLAIVVFGVRLHGSSLRTIFGPRWCSAGQIFRDLGLGVLLLLVSILVASIIGGHQQGATPGPSIEFLLPHTWPEMLIWIALSITAGICEEAVYRGYLQRQFIVLSSSVPAGILFSGAAFGAAHAYQGIRRALAIGVSAVLFGLFAHWRGTVRPGMFAHALQDAVAPWLIKLVRH